MPQQKQKRIAIITYSGAYNYGSALQTYALNRYLSTNGFYVKTLNYSTPQQQNLYRLFEPYNGVMSLVRNAQSLVCYKQLQKHIIRFQHFLNSNVPLSEKIEDTKYLISLNDEYDYFVCGSDQIWNADCDDFDTNYMLSFVKEKNKCIAYAPSLGAGANSKSTIDTLKEYVPDFKALSSREKLSSDIISNITHREVATTADPVFLLSKDQWDEVSSDRVIKGDYILGYFIGDRPGMRDFAKKMQKASGLPVIVIYKSIRDIKYNFARRYDCGPAEFISLIKNSTGIVTNSFHAVAFSLIYQKDFWVFAGKGTADSRITGILDTVGLKNRIVDSDKFIMNDYLDRIRYVDLDFSGMQSYIDSSKNYLINNLG